ncbi:MAG: preprotein translocase subunit YajC [Alphaproteobacteria bacterium]|nr:preprotein translocase subunit YajC [Rickettsiales bacterium]
MKIRFNSLRSLFYFTFTFFLSSVAFGNAAFASTDVERNPFVNMIPFFVVMVLFYILMVLPQRKKQKNTQSMLDNVSVGDTVVTSSGIIGKISKVDDTADTVIILANEKTELLMYKKFIVDVLSDSNKCGTRSNPKQVTVSSVKTSGKK